MQIRKAYLKSLYEEENFPPKVERINENISSRNFDVFTTLTPLQLYWNHKLVACVLRENQKEVES